MSDMREITDRKRVHALTLLFTITYMVSYITRINYGAIISAMVKETGIAKSLLSISLTGSFITYGAGQIISGYYGDKHQPKTLVFLGLLVTSAMNTMITFCKTPYQMVIVWCINGFAQALMWPPIVRLITYLFTSEDYKKASVRISWGSSLGTILIYLIAPLLLSFFSWKSVFLSSSLCGVCMALFWHKFCPKILEEKRQQNYTTQNKTPSLFTPLILSIMLAIMLQGALRDGVTTWMPSYISETYHLSSNLSILTGVILPVFGILCFQIASYLYRKIFVNPLQCAAVIFGTGTLAALILRLFSGHTAVVSVLFSAVLTGCMHGVNLILICMVPPYFKKYGNVSMVSGILNSSTYVGSAISTYGIALLSEHYGWNVTLLLWFMIAATGTVLCFSGISAWNRSHSDSGL